MALIQATLVSSITTGQLQTDAITKFANDLASAIDTYIKTATVNVTVTGTAAVTTAPGVAPVTGSGVGTLS